MTRKNPGAEPLGCDNNHIICGKTGASQADWIPHQVTRQKFWSGNFSRRTTLWRGDGEGIKVRRSLEHCSVNSRSETI